MNVLSIDVEDWYHPLDPEPSHWDRYEDRIDASIDLLLDVLKQNRTCATFFILGAVAERHPELVRRIEGAGHEIGTHGYWHRFIYHQSAADFEEDVGRSVTLLTSITGKAVLGYRAPYFSVTRQSAWVWEVLARLGIRYDSSVFPVYNHRYGIPEAPRTPYVHPNGIHELPIACLRCGGVNIPCGGGVYFRAFPYAFTRLLLKRKQARGEPIVFYLHPWELDPGNPVLPVRRTLRYRVRWNLGRTAGRLARLLQDFRFTCAKEALGL